jgi:hypothetical protein
MMARKENLKKKSSIILKMPIPKISDEEGKLRTHNY